MALRTAIDATHDEVKALGWRMLQPFRFADDDRGHVEALLSVADFPFGGRVLDVGCGVGECARLMQRARPDLDFVLVNFSARQLADCPEHFEQHLADAHALPFADESFDAVMFNAALGNMDAEVALAEAVRVLKPGGVLFLNEVARVAGDNAAMERVLCFRAQDVGALMDFMAAMGAVETALDFPQVDRYYLREHMNADAYDLAFDGTVPFLARYVKTGATGAAARFGSIFGRHERVALQFSGGKDSLATLHLMRPWWPRLTVYWCNPGDPFPETLALMDEVRALVPRFVEVAGRQREVIAADGWPSDIVPQAYTSDGNFVFGPTPFKVQSRLSCCFRALMWPMHERMLADGVTCIFRGKRSEEKDKSPTRSGDVVDGIELVYPLWNWTAADVLSFLESAKVRLPKSYRLATHSLDCMSCTAWWGEGLTRHLEAEHPVEYAERLRRITLIKSAIADEMQNCEV